MGRCSIITRSFFFYCDDDHEDFDDFDEDQVDDDDAMAKYTHVPTDLS